MSLMYISLHVHSIEQSTFFLFLPCPPTSNKDHVQGPGVLGGLKHEEMVGRVVGIVAESKRVGVQIESSNLRENVGSAQLFSDVQ
jgi:hypothetical protein